jgi:hypothetical protein
MIFLRGNPRTLMREKRRGKRLEKNINSEKRGEEKESI